jgi:pimeloyl-ACP methyl ester carboxylesterase
VAKKLKKHNRSKKNPSKSGDTTMSTQTAKVTDQAVRHKTVSIDGQEVFYREAGSSAAPVLLLLHGFPTSSNMFRNLIPKLAEKFHVIAPDYIGYGHSSMPAHDTFSYTFENQTNFVEKLTEELNLGKYILYVMDYGAPIGYRLAIRHPERVAGLIIQNGNAYEGGLLKFWDPIKEYWKDRSSENENKVVFLVGLDATKWQYQNGVSDLSLLDPTAWTMDQHGLDRPGNGSVQLDMLYDYQTNVPLYPQFQEFFRKYQPPTLILWGNNDFIFPPDGADLYKKDLPHLEMHMFDTGHFALETHGDEMAELILKFFA